MIEAGFFEGQRGAVFQVLHPPRGTGVRGTVLYVHPFAEEMNKARRMVALQSRRLADHGFAVLLPDHYGCGDSEGEFQDATWEIWRGDLARSAAWLRDRFGRVPLVLWGLRTGCLLASELMTLDGVVPDRCVFWQPTTNGELYLNQFLRLRVAAGMLSGQKESVKDLRRSLQQNQIVEVAGYGLSSGLVEPLARARLVHPPCAVDWLEVVAVGVTALSPAGQRLLDAWREQGVRVVPGVVPGEPFWSTQTVCEVPALLDETTSRLLDAY